MIVLALSSIALMLALSAGAHRLIPLEHRRLPMQWSVKGAVNWTAPRAAALLLTPALMAVLMIAVSWLADANERDPALLALCVIGPLVHGLQMLLTVRTCGSKSGPH